VDLSDLSDLSERDEEGALSTAFCATVDDTAELVVVLVSLRFVSPFICKLATLGTVVIGELRCSDFGRVLIPFSFGLYSHGSTSSCSWSHQPFSLAVSLSTTYCGDSTCYIALKGLYLLRRFCTFRSFKKKIKHTSLLL
jgi:hypothetical protein